jgi:3-hydroxyacyl-CoA dehydrogenase
LSEIRTVAVVGAGPVGHGTAPLAAVTGWGVPFAEAMAEGRLGRKSSLGFLRWADR